MSDFSLESQLDFIRRDPLFRREFHQSSRRDNGLSSARSPMGQNVDSLPQGLQAGDDCAADEVFRRYLPRLRWLAAWRLCSRMAQRIDADDVVLSACRAFYAAVQERHFRCVFDGELSGLPARRPVADSGRGVVAHPT